MARCANERGRGERSQPAAATKDPSDERGESRAHDHADDGVRTDFMRREITIEADWHQRGIDVRRQRAEHDRQTATFFRRPTLSRVFETAADHDVAHRIHGARRLRVDL